MMDFYTSLIGDTSFWVMVSTVLCFGFIAYKASKPMRESLDNRAKAISDRLDEAEALRLKAEEILKEYKEKSENALHEAESVLHNAQRRAELMRVQMEKELTDSITRQETAAKNRISRMEEDAINAIKNQIITATLTQVKQHANDTQMIAPSIDHSMDDIKKILKK